MFTVAMKPLEGAICPTLPPEQKLWFFSEEGSTGSYKCKAKEICSRCPVHAACLKQALDFESQPENGIFGIVGGKSAEERKEMLRKSKEGRVSA